MKNGTVDVDKVPDFVKNFLDADGRIDPSKLPSFTSGSDAKRGEEPASEETNSLRMLVRERFCFVAT